MDKIAKNRIVTTSTQSLSTVMADLYLCIRPLDNSAMREYISRFFPSTDESSTEQELSADFEEQAQRIAALETEGTGKCKGG